MENYSVTFFASEKETIETEIVKVKRKLNKFNVPYKYSFSDTFKSDCKQFLLQTVTFDIENEVISYDGFEYLATLEKAKDKLNYVYSESKEDFSQYFEVKFRCDHCNTNRDRKKVHLFRDSNGNDKMIASTCSKDYFGESVQKKIESVLKVFDIFYKLSEDFEPSEEKMGSFYKEFDVRSYIQHSLYICLKHKEYISKERAESEVIMSTINYIDETFEKFPNDFYDIINGYDFVNVIEYWENKVKEDRSNFSNNVYLSFYTSNPKKGLIAWGVWSYLKDGLKLFEVKTKDEYFGEIKDRCELELKVVSVNSGSGAYGYWELFSLVDRDGRNFKWFSSSSNDNIQKSIDTNDFVKVKATIKKHEEYKGKKQTMLTRVK